LQGSFVLIDVTARLGSSVGRKINIVKYNPHILDIQCTPTDSTAIIKHCILNGAIQYIMGIYVQKHRATSVPCAYTLEHPAINGKRQDAPTELEGPIRA
jgi:hypothetical protein